MGVPYIPGYEAQLGPALANIGQALGSILKPNQGFQLALRNAFVQDPSLIQKFTDIEKSAPGTLASLGFGKATDVISRVPESLGSMIQRGLKPGVESALQRPDIIAGTGEQAVTGRSPGATAQDAFELEGYRQAKAFFQNNPEVSIQDILTGKVKPQVAFALSKSGAGQFLGFQLQAYLNQQDIEARTKLARAGDVSSLQDAVAKSKVNQAFSRYQATNAGSPAAWAAYMFGPDIAKLIGDVNPDDLQAVKVGDKRATAQERITQQFQSSRYLTDLDNKVRNYQGEETGRTFLVQQLNDVLGQMNQYGGPKLTAVWKKPIHVAGIPVPFTGRELVYRDENGKEFTDPTVAIGGAISSAAQSGTSVVPGSENVSPPPSAQAIPDTVFMGLFRRFNGDRAKINEELRRLGYPEQ
jgi:hypothetical protein